MGYNKDHGNSSMRDTIIKIDQDVGVLTSPLDLYNSKIFMEASKALEVEDVKSIVELILNNYLTINQSKIAISLVANNYDENQYWELMFPVLKKGDMLNNDLLFVLLSPIPHGPGYANAYNVSPYKEELIDLRSKLIKQGNSSEAIDYFITGKASADTIKFAKNPETLNCSNILIKYLGKSWEKYK